MVATIRSAVGRAYDGGRGLPDVSGDGLGLNVTRLWYSNSGIDIFLSSTAAFLRCSRAWRRDSPPRTLCGIFVCICASGARSALAPAAAGIFHAHAQSCAINPLFLFSFCASCALLLLHRFISVAKAYQRKSAAWRRRRFSERHQRQRLSVSWRNDIAWTDTRAPLLPPASRTRLRTLPRIPPRLRTACCGCVCPPILATPRLDCCSLPRGRAFAAGQHRAIMN